MAKSPFDEILGLAKAAIASAALEDMRQLRQEVAARHGERHVWSLLIRAGEIYQGRQADALARKYGFDHAPTQQYGTPPSASLIRAGAALFGHAAQAYRSGLFSMPRLSPAQPLPDPNAAPELAYAMAMTAREASNHELALQWFMIARGKGHTAAKRMLADYFERGEHVERDIPLAGHLLVEAMEAGDRGNAPADLNRVAHRFQCGDGTVKDLQRAFSLFCVAAEAGNMHARYNAGFYLWRGTGGTKKDLATARRLFELSATQGYADAVKALAEMDKEAARERPPQQQAHMSRAQALEILELKEGAGKAEMKVAWVRLMQANHPDKGGSTYFAKQLNEVREVLGF